MYNKPQNINCKFRSQFSISDEIALIKEVSNSGISSNFLVKLQYASHASLFGSNNNLYL
jgi:hypothetical protein